MSENFKLIHALILWLTICVTTQAQDIQKKVILNWTGVQTISGPNYSPVKALCASDMQNNSFKNYRPEYFGKFTLPKGSKNCSVQVTHTVWEPIEEELLKTLSYPLIPDDTLSPLIVTETERGANMAMISFSPIIKNPKGGVMRLKSFQLDIVCLPSGFNDNLLKSTKYVPHSILSNGTWYKIKTDKTGVYKVTYADLKSWGIDMTTVTPDKIRLFGNGGGMLPESNSVIRYDDLTENAISVVTANKNTFTQGDYFLFYGTSPNKMAYNSVSGNFEHELNIYSDHTYYFLNFNGGEGKRIQSQEQTSLEPNYTSTEFSEGIFYEKDMLNLIRSGKDWVGERMDANAPVFELSEYTFPNIKSNREASIRFRLVARAFVPTNFVTKINNQTVSTSTLSEISPDPNETRHATETVETKHFLPVTDMIKVSFAFNGKGTAIGWLDWLEINVTRDLIFTGGQLIFSDPASVSPDRVTEFQLKSSSPNVIIWNVTDPVKAIQMLSSYQNGINKFFCKTDFLNQFIAWDNTTFLSATFAEKVINQDLHGIESADMLIVAHKDYLEQANRLADHHRKVDGFKVTVATNEQIYNEFSSGSPDAAAIRDFARMLYTRPAVSDKLQYLLLFGDGSYDFKDRVQNNSNKVLTFQAKESLNTVSSFASDDFYGLLDENEGQDAYGLIDIGIGRFPVSKIEQAKVAVDKCLFYASNNKESLGDWRNKLCFVADNGNGNMHFSQVEKDLCPKIEEIAPEFNLNKVYLDAYKLVTTPTGQKCPDANAAITSNVQNGVLVMNYTGHGGETSWADEGILSISEIDSWTNYNNMPVFMTATCSFSRYDDPKQMSAGEHVFLNPAGGGIALFTTTRLAESGTNIMLTLSFYDTLFSKFNGEYPRFGNVIANAKNHLGNNATMIRNFVLLGDPVLRLAYPKYQVLTTQINGHALITDPDTIIAMTPVTIKGIIADGYGNKFTGFTGLIDVKIFDKARTLSTLGTDPTDYPDNFIVQDNYIYQGRATVTNGDFTFEFIVPRDINYSYGPGKVSYYAFDGKNDATGFSKQIIIGGSGKESADVQGPVISLFMDDLSFKDGGITGETPTLIAKLSDASGINTINNAIGHDIVATVDGDIAGSLVLNSYYSADVDSYRSGVVKYKFSELAEGQHSLTFKSWDVFNNSSEANISFVVDKNRQLSITNMNIYPNPFREEVKVDFEINLSDTPVNAQLEVFNINGSMVSSTENKLLLTQGYKAGMLTWDGRNSSGRAVNPGIYLISIRASNGKSETVRANRVIKLK